MGENSVAQENKEAGCPKCRARSYLVPTCTVFLTLANWPLMFIIGGGVIVCAGILDMVPADSLLFALLAIAPLCAGIRRKKLCLQCRIEFEPSETAA